MPLRGNHAAFTEKVQAADINAMAAQLNAVVSAGALVVVPWSPLRGVLQPFPFANAPRKAEQPAGSLQTQINLIGGGGTCTPTPGVYRESITVNTNITLDGQNGAVEIRGSDDWSTGGAIGNTWTGPVAGLWTSSATVTNFTRNDLPDSDYTDTFIGKNLEQVFINGFPLTHVAASPVAGQYMLDASRHVQLAQDPTGALVEVTQRATWGALQANNITVQGVTFRHVATSPNTSRGLGGYGYTGQIIQNCTFMDAHGNAVSPDNNTGAKVMFNTFLRCGAFAIGASAGSGLLVKGNRIYYCGHGGYRWNSNGGIAAGMKFVGLTGTDVIDSNVVAFCPQGIWADINCVGTTISNNRIHDIGGADPGGNGIMFEASQGPSRVTKNWMWNMNLAPAWQGDCIFVNSATQLEVDNNVCVFNQFANGIYIQQDARQDPIHDINVHDNQIICLDGDAAGVGAAFSGTGGGLRWKKGGGVLNPFVGNNNVGTNNTFWWPIPSPPADSSQNRWEWNDTRYATIAGFAATAGGTGSAYMTDATKNAAVAPLQSWQDP